MNVGLLIAAALAGGLGAGLRHVVDALVAGRGRRRFPGGILVVNVTGSFALGVLTGLGTALVDGDVAWVLGVGLLGGYTTFSTVSLDTVLLARERDARGAWINAAGTLAAGVAAATIGLLIGRVF